jgi:hypothetical protein
VAPTVARMRCCECGRDREPADRGWVIVLSHDDLPRTLYCSECITEIIRGASGENERDED